MTEGIPFAGHIEIDEHRDLEFPGFCLRFFRDEESDDWICRMPTSSMDMVSLFASKLTGDIHAED
jgi:hypothetical protein